MQYNTVVKYNSEYSYQYSIRGTSNHQINRTDITSAVINTTKTFTTQLSSKLKINLQTTVWGWVVGRDYGV